MRRHLDTLADKGCWISHDRIYAFISAGYGLTELGYHGMQPVSRNSRVLVKDSGVLSFSLRSAAGDQKLQTNEVDWQPSKIEAESGLTTGSCSMSIQPSGRQISIRFRLTSVTGQSIIVSLARTALFSLVQGERTWSEFRREGNSLVVSFRDRIMLQPWLNQTGPYAGDFLIPEPVRRRIFSRGTRSGLATREDLREEYRTADMAIYDSETSIRFGGSGFSIRVSPDGWSFERALGPDQEAEFIVECRDVPEAPRHSAASGTVPGVLSTPALTLTSFPHIEEFIGTVPGLVDSCVVHDFGIPRACPGRYYWIWAWDALVTMSEALRWGDVDRAAASSRFIEAHRDENGHIPARWTRSLQPLDTPSAGGIEFLQLSLVYETFLETGNRSTLIESLPSFLSRFEAVESELLQRGLVTGEGFYPDLLSAFGRTSDSAVCMEVGSWYGFSRMLGNIAREMGNPQLAERTESVAASIARRFDDLFWDEEAGFCLDSVNIRTGLRSPLHPLFALLFLQTQLAMPLIRPHLQRMSEYIQSELLVDAGIRVLSLQEAGTAGEAILDSWYPHWDLYALKLMRRAGDAKSIMRWLAAAERALSALGYCPEFLALKGFREGNPGAWGHHGSASNLNCVTSWFRGARESVIGFEADPGGLTHFPLSLPLPAARLDGIRWRGTTWSLECLYNGPHFQHLIVDGTVVDGCTKIPFRFQTPGNHHVAALYGDDPPRPCFTEFLNAKLLSCERRNDAIDATIEPIGGVEVAFYSSDPTSISVDGRAVSAVWNPDDGRGFFTLHATAQCTIRMIKR
jgi:hypothetical protein